MHVGDGEQFAAEAVDEGDHEAAVVSLCRESSFDGGERREFYVEEVGEFTVVHGRVSGDSVENFFFVFRQGGLVHGV